MGKENPFATFESFRAYIQFVLPESVTWGQGDSKPIEKLWAEIEKKDCKVVEKRGQVLRLTWPVFVTVQYDNGGLHYELFEEYQQFQGGHIRSRTLPGSIGEKGTVGEKPDHAAWRAIKEELGGIPLSLEAASMKFLQRWEELEEARSYPGLYTRSRNSSYSLTVRPNQGAPRPFQVVEFDVITHFNWNVIE